MKFVPDAISRKLTDQALMARKHSPTILLGAGIVSMVGSTVLACRATLQLEETLSDIQAEKNRAAQVKHHVDSEEYTGKATYTDEEMAKDVRVIIVRGAAQVVKLYTPAVVLGGVGVLCLTKSHAILRERNAALTAAYIAVDSAFRAYRERVIDRYGEETDRDLRYDYEDVDVIDDDTGKLYSTTRAAPGEPSGYARWFGFGNSNWHAAPFEHDNAMFLRSQQNWANDVLRSRGHLFLNEAYEMCGLSHTSAGSIVGWVYDRNNEVGDNYVDFGCWDPETGRLRDFFNGREGEILLDFNVDGPIWQLLDERRERRDG